MLKKICFIISDLNMGGSQRVFLHLINNLDRKIYDVNLILIKERGGYFQKIKSDVTIVELKCRVLKSMFKLIKEIRKIQPDVVISTIVDLNLYLGLFVIPFLKNKKIKFIARESHVLSMTHSSFIKKKLKKLSMKNFDCIIAQSQDMYKDIINNFMINENKCKIINNPVDNLEIEKYVKTNQLLEYEVDNKNLLYVGRLTHQKGVDYLIPIMRELKDSFIKLYIIGVGEERENLEKEIRKYRLEDKIILLGRKENPYIYMTKADLFLLPSRYEGFPNVLIEANMCGKYCVINKALGGINEIIENGINGEIIDFKDFRETAKKIKELLEKDLVIRSEKIKKITLEKYSLNKILEEYHKVFLK